MTNHHSSSTTTTTTSSLALAASTTKQAPAFESCFAQGLDLSEFQSTENGTTAKCASAALLQQVEQRRLDKARNAQEEQRLEARIEERTQNLKKRAMNEVSLALVGMHQTDEHGAQKVCDRRHKKKGKNNKKPPQRVVAAKTSKKTKFRRTK